MKNRVRLVVATLVTAIVSMTYAFACYRNNSMDCTSSCPTNINNQCTEGSTGTLLFGTYAGYDGNPDHPTGGTSPQIQQVTCQCAYSFWSPSHQQQWSATCYTPTIQAVVAIGSGCTQ